MGGWVGGWKGAGGVGGVAFSTCFCPEWVVCISISFFASVRKYGGRGWLPTTCVVRSSGGILFGPLVFCLTWLLTLRNLLSHFVFVLYNVTFFVHVYDYS